MSNTLNGQPIFSSCKSDIEKNKNIEFIFWAKSQLGGQLATATSSLSSPPYTNYGIESFTLTTNWTEYTFISESDSTILVMLDLLSLNFLRMVLTILIMFGMRRYLLSLLFVMEILRQI